MFVLYAVRIGVLFFVLYAHVLACPYVRAGGEGGVGKSAITLQLVHKKFVEGMNVCVCLCVCCGVSRDSRACIDYVH